MLISEKKGKVSIFWIRIRIHEAPMLFQQNKQKFQFSKFEFQLMTHPCYFRKKRKSLYFLSSNSNSNTWGTDLISGKERKLLIFSIRIRIRIYEALLLFFKKKKSLYFPKSNSTSISNSWGTQVILRKKANIKIFWIRIQIRSHEAASLF